MNIMMSELCLHSIRRPGVGAGLVNGLILDKSLKYLKIIIYVEVATLMAMVREQIVDILGQFYLNHHHGPTPQITQLTAQRTKQISIREKMSGREPGNSRASSICIKNLSNAGRVRIIWCNFIQLPAVLNPTKLRSPQLAQTASSTEALSASKTGIYLNRAQYKQSIFYPCHLIHSYNRNHRNKDILVEYSLPNLLRTSPFSALNRKHDVSIILVTR